MHVQTVLRIVTWRIASAGVVRRAGRIGGIEAGIVEAFHVEAERVCDRRACLCVKNFLRRERDSTDAESGMLRRITDRRVRLCQTVGADWIRATVRAIKITRMRGAVVRTVVRALPTVNDDVVKQVDDRDVLIG